MYSCSLYFPQLHPYSLAAALFTSAESVDEERVIAEAEASLETTESLITTSIYDQVLPKPQESRNSRTPQQASLSNQPSRVSLNSSSVIRHDHQHHGHSNLELTSNLSDSPSNPRDEMDLSSVSSEFAPPPRPPPPAPLNFTSFRTRLLRGNNTANVDPTPFSSTPPTGVSSARGGHLFDEITSSTNEDGDDEGQSVDAEELPFEESFWYRA